MMKKCSSCRKFLSKLYHHRICRKCKRRINKASREEIQKEPEVYLGKLEVCGLCESKAYLYNNKKFSKKICKDCEKWINKLEFLEVKQ